MLSSSTTTTKPENEPQKPTVAPIRVETFNLFPVNKLWKFQVYLNTNQNKQSDLSVNITNPILGTIDKQVEWISPSQCHVTFRVPMVGIYNFDLELSNKSDNKYFSLKFQAKAYDLSKVFIAGSSGKCRLGENYEFSVDASEAGEGQLEIAVNEGEIPNQVQVLDNGKCIVSFTPEDCVSHLVDIKFNGHDVNGCPFVVEVYDHDDPNPALDIKQQLQPPELIKEDRILVDTTCTFVLANLKLKGQLEKNDILILDPESQPVDYELIEDVRLNRFQFKFRPTIVGDFSVELRKKSTLASSLPLELVEQFPFPLKVFDYTKVSVLEITDGVIGHPIYFFIDASRAGSGNLEIRVSSKTRNVPNYPQSEANAKIRVHFTPTEANDHTIDVKFNGISVPGNPFLVRVAQYPQARLPISSQDSLKYIALDELVNFYIDYIGNGQKATANKSEPSCQVYALRPDFVYAKLAHVEMKQVEGKNGESLTKFKVSFKPTKIGPYKLFMTVNNELIPGCPVVSNVYNINEVRVSFDEDSRPTSKPVARLKQPFTFIVDASRAGEGTLALAVISGLSQDPVQTDVKVSERGHGLYHLTFVPTEFATHSIDMSFNERIVPQSPFLVDIVNDKGELASSKKEASVPAQLQEVSAKSNPVQSFENLSLKSSLKKPTAATTSKKSLAFGLVNTSNIVYLESGVLESSDRSQVALIGPTKEKVPFVIGKGSPQPGEPKKAFIEYKPKCIGTHTISIIDGPNNLHQYFVEICNPSLAKIVDLDPDNAFEVGRPVRLCVDSKDSGEIQLDYVSVTGPKRSIMSAATEVINGAADSPTTLSKAKSTGAQLNHVEYTQTRLDELRQEISFTPQSVGKYTIDIRCLGQPVGASPVEIEVKPVAAAGGSKLAVAEGFSSRQVANNSGSNVSKPEKHPAMPSGLSREEELLRNIVVHGVSLKCSPVNSTGAFIIETNRLAQARDFDVLITDPSNNLVDVQCYLQQDGNLLAEWTPRRIGTHKIEVLYLNKQVPGSPFVTEAFDPSGVIIENIKSTVFSVGDKIEFKINRNQAGLGDLDVAITSPLGQDLPIDVKPADGENEVELISFTPTVAGKYKMSITFSGYEVPKSPITFTARSTASELVKVSGTGLRCAEVNRSAQFVVDTLSEGELKMRIECGDREIVPKVEKVGNSYNIKYKPIEIGYASISLYWNGAHVEGSPHSVPVNDLTKIQFVQGADRLTNHSSNQRIAYYEPTVPSLITLDTSRCGPGQLKAEAYCRANPNLKFSLPVISLSAHRYRVEFLCPPKADQLPKHISTKDLSLEAAYLIRFYYNNLVVPESLASVLLPRSGSHSEQSSSSELSSGINGKTRRDETQNSLDRKPIGIDKEANNNKSTDEIYRLKRQTDCPIVALRGHGLVEARSGNPAEFTIDGSEAGPGEPEVRLSGKSDEAITVKLEQLEDKIFKASYVAQKAGIYSLNVLWDGQQVAGCPISVNIQAPCDPSKVLCTGDGLKGGVLGQEIKCFIDTRRAGPGELTAKCTGSQKATFCDLLDREDGTFILDIKPQEPGRQFLSIKYDGQHIPKSPFLIKISGKPDPSKVRVHGPGVEHGVLSLYQSRFVCDTRGAGAGQLTVRIRGPKGAFRMETERESQRDRTILCKYDPTEPGDYRIEIKWSGRHVPGSPFCVMIFDTQEELNRYVMGGGHSNTSKLFGPAQSTIAPMLHQVPYQPSMVDYGHYSNLTQPGAQQRQPPYRMQ